MNTQFTIKNFRVFDEEGVTLDIKPITILTGCNSSGKSSIVKGICLLNEFIQNIKEAKRENRPFNLSQYKLDFKKKPNHLLGGFAKTIHNQSSEKKVTFQYRVHSHMLGCDVDVEFVFVDICNDGYLHSLVIRKTDGEELYSSVTTNEDDWRGGNTTINYESLRTACIRFVDAQCKMNDVLKFYEKELLLYSLNAEKKEEEFSRIELPGKRFSKCVDLLEVSDENHGVEKSLIECHLNFVNEGLEQAWNDATLWFKKHETAFLDVYESRSYDKNGKLKEEKNPFYIDSNVVQSLKAIDDNDCLYTNSNTLKVEAPGIPTTHDIISSLWHNLRQNEKKELMSDRLEAFLLGVYDTCLDDPIGVLSYYASLTIEEIMSVEMPNSINYVGSDIVNIRRFYPLEETDSITELWKQYTTTRKKGFYRIGDSLTYFDTGGYGPKTVPTDNFINKWLQEFKVCDHFTIKTFADGAGAEIRLHADKEDKEGTIMADYGYGITQFFTMLMSVGVAKPGQTIAIEEPEIHLHPSFQSKLAEMFVEAYQEYNIHFIIETHSEYLIRKLQVMVADKERSLTSNDVSLNYVEKGENDVSTNRKIEIHEDGRLSEPFGPGFFDESKTLVMEMLKF